MYMITRCNGKLTLPVFTLGSSQNEDLKLKKCLQINSAAHVITLAICSVPREVKFNSEKVVLHRDTCLRKTSALLLIGDGFAVMNGTWLNSDKE